MNNQVNTTATQANSPALLAAYTNGGYAIEIFANGTKVRREIDPSLPPRLPEQMDLKITD